MVDELNVVLYGNCSDLWLREAIALALYHHSWQMDTEAASFIDHTFDCYSSTHLLNPFLDQRKAKASAAVHMRACILRLVEALPDMRQVFRCHALAGIFDLNRNRFSFRSHRYGNDTPWRCMTHGIVQQILHDLFQAIHIHQREGQFRSYLCYHLDLARSPRERSHGLDDAPDDFSAIGWLTTALDQCQRTGARLMLVLALVLGPGEFDGSAGHVIPRVVDADAPEQHRR